MTTTTSAPAHLTRRPTSEPRSTAAVHLTASTARFRYDIGIVGLGYVGLPTALAFHTAGRRVLGIDASPARLADIEAGYVDLLASDHDRLRSALEAAAGSFELAVDAVRLREAQTVIVCVPTPVDEHLVPDLTILRRACASVVEQAVPGQTLILTSTTYVGSTQDMLIRPLAERGLMAGDHVAWPSAPSASTRATTGTATTQ